jgi:periplasmic protein TonB
MPPKRRRQLLSDGENPAPMLLSVDADLRDAGTASPFWRRDDWLAIVAALLLHAITIAAFLVDWRLPPTAPPESIPVTIVFAPPPAPMAAPAAQPKPPLFDRESGKDERTTAPPSAEVTDSAPTRAPGSAAALPEPLQPQAAAPTAPPGKPAPSRDAMVKTHDAVTRLDPRKEADRARASHPAPERLHIEPGDREQTGDPYANRVTALLERHRTYPNVLGRYGVPVEGTPVYEFVLDRKGRILGLKLVASSGTTALDDAGAAMIRETAPFPPLPPEYPGDGLIVTYTVHLFPKPPW